MGDTIRVPAKCESVVTEPGKPAQKRWDFTCPACGRRMGSWSEEYRCACGKTLQLEPKG